MFLKMTGRGGLCVFVCVRARGGGGGVIPLSSRSGGGGDIKARGSLSKSARICVSFADLWPRVCRHVL